MTDGHAAAGGRIAVIDDEPRIRELIQLALSHHGYEVRTANDGQAGLALVKSWAPDAIVLDVMMPKIDGITLLPMLRQVTESPVIMLSARGEVEDKVSGLSHGADDYLSKPFEISELIAHVDAKLRRPHLEHPSVLHYSDLHVDLERHIVERSGRQIDLSPLEYNLLIALLRRPGRVFTREELLDNVWSDDSDAGPGAVERYVSYLRAKVDDDFAARLIHTVRGVGYTIRAD
jgi:two-component system OmpR family response regulator